MKPARNRALNCGEENKLAVLTLPDHGALVRIVREALDEVAPTLRDKTAGWADDIGGAIKKRLIDLHHAGIECAYGHHKNEDDELLFDFCALLYDPPDEKKERYPVQPLIVGEIECHDNLRKDFEKLLLADSLVYFFVLPSRIQRREKMDALPHFEEIADLRRTWAARRGMIPSPVFIIASHSRESGKFTYEFSPNEAATAN